MQRFRVRKLACKNPCTARVVCCGRQLLQNFTASRWQQHCLLVYLLTLIILVPFTMYHVQYSPLYNYMLRKGHVEKYGGIKDAISDENRLRLGDAEAYLQDFKRRRVAGPSLCTTVITMKRPDDIRSGPRGYLTQSMARLLNAERDSLTPLQLHLCNVQHFKGPDLSEYEQMARFADVLSSMSDAASESDQRLNVSAIVQLSRIAQLEADVNAKRKECLDYAFCIARALLLCESAGQEEASDSQSLLSQYLLVLEDDAALRNDTFHTLRNVMHRLHVSVPSHRDAVQTVADIGFVKLYHPQRLTGYFSGWELDRLPELLGLACVGGLLLALLYRRSCEKSSEWRHFWQRRSFYMLLVSTTVYTALVFGLLGRHSVVEPIRRLSAWSHLLVSPAPSCCTPAMLYSRSHAAALVQHLLTTCANECQEKSKCSKDLVMYEFMQQANLLTYYVYPNLVDHIGLLSTLGNYVLHPYIAA